MASQAQIEANRRNAQLSTGPKTPQGKARCIRNPLKHGLRSREAVLDTERREEFESFAEALRAELTPRTQWQALLVERVVLQAWRLRRAARLEAAVLSHAMDPAKERDAHWRKREWEEARQAARQRGEEEKAVPDPCPRSWPGEVHPYFLGEAVRGMLTSSGPLDVLRRYERTSERAMYEAMKALQASRRLDAEEEAPEREAVGEPEGSNETCQIDPIQDCETEPIPVCQTDPSPPEVTASTGVTAQGREAAGASAGAPEEPSAETRPATLSAGGAESQSGVIVPAGLATALHGAATVEGAAGPACDSNPIVAQAKRGLPQTDTAGQPTAPEMCQTNPIPAFQTNPVPSCGTDPIQLCQTNPIPPEVFAKAIVTASGGARQGQRPKASKRDSKPVSRAEMAARRARTEAMLEEQFKAFWAARVPQR